MVAVMTRGANPIVHATIWMWVDPTGAARHDPVSKKEKP
jgi:hypothetical protein